MTVEEKTSYHIGKYYPIDPPGRMGETARWVGGWEIFDTLQEMQEYMANVSARAPDLKFDYYIETRRYVRPPSSFHYHSIPVTIFFKEILRAAV